jgi:metal-dependent amidase/aminoacylase/carboxypeptidase family protein
MPVIVNSGKDNGLIPETSEIVVHINGFRQSFLDSAVEKVKNCIHAGAIATGCSVMIEEHAGYKGRVCSYVLGDVLRHNFESLGEELMPGMIDDNGGEDFGNLNRFIPGVMVFPTLLPGEKISNHTIRFRELANSERARDVILLGSKGLAYSVLDLLYDTSIIVRAKEELRELQHLF